MKPKKESLFDGRRTQVSELLSDLIVILTIDCRIFQSPWGSSKRRLMVYTLLASSTFLPPHSALRGDDFDNRTQSRYFDNGSHPDLASPLPHP
jgi:hypothetical protein